MRNFFSGCCKSTPHRLFIFGRATAQALEQDVHVGGQDEDRDRVGLSTFDLASALVVDVEDDAPLALGEHQLFTASPVEVAVDFCPCQKLACGDQLDELTT